MRERLTSAPDEAIENARANGHHGLAQEMLDAFREDNLHHGIEVEAKIARIGAEVEAKSR